MGIIVYVIIHLYCDITNFNLKTLIDVIPNLNLNNILTILSTKVHSYPRYEKRIKLMYGLIRHMNIYTSQQVLPIHM